MQRRSINLLTTIVFLGCCIIGAGIASKRTISNDEYYSLVATIHGTSYKDYLFGKIPEGNNAPLFYFIQKVFIDITPLEINPKWLKGEWVEANIQERLLHRINPILFMSLSITLVFYFFVRYFGLLTALLSLFIYASCFMLWHYWAESRPYALWIFLTTGQSLFLISVLRKQRPSGVIFLGVWNVFLSLTTIFSLASIWMSAIILFCNKYRDWRGYAFLLLLPSIIIFYFYWKAPHYSFYFGLTPEQLIRENVSRDKIYILLGFGGVLAYRLIKRGFSAIKSVAFYYLYAAGLFLSAIILLFFFKMNAKPEGVGFPVSSRYFVYLVPVAVIATAWACHSMSRSLQAKPWLQKLLWIGLGALLIPRFLKIIPEGLQFLKG